MQEKTTRLSDLIKQRGQSDSEVDRLTTALSEADVNLKSIVCQPHGATLDYHLIQECANQSQILRDQLTDESKRHEQTNAKILAIRETISASKSKLADAEQNYLRAFCVRKTSRILGLDGMLFGHVLLFLRARELPAIVATSRVAVQGVRQTKAHLRLGISDVRPRLRFQYCCYIMRLKPLVRDLHITIGRKEGVILEKLLSAIGKGLKRLTFSQFNMDYYPECYPPVSNHV